MSEVHKNYIGGEWVAGDAATRDVNPSNANDIVGEYSYASAAQTEAAVAAAKAAFPAWSRTTPQERHDILLRVSQEILARREELGRLLAREEGKPLPEAIGECGRAGQIFDFFAGETLRIPGEKMASVRPGVDIEITREAVGGVGIIAPGDFPDRVSGLEDRAGARLRQPRRLQARRSRAGMRARARRDHRACGSAEGRLQSRHGTRFGGRPGDARPSQGRRD